MNSNREAAVGIQELCIDRSIDDTNKGDRAERLETLYGIISTKFNILMYNKELKKKLKTRKKIEIWYITI